MPPGGGIVTRGRPSLAIDPKLPMPLPAKILIVDDEPHVRSFLRKLVHAHLARAAVVEAMDAPTAVAAFERERPDLVLLDINLIGETGLVALAEIRQLNPEAVVIMVTSVANVATVTRALEGGATGYLLKDTPLDDLVLALRDIVQEAFGDITPPPAGLAPTSDPA
jgi:two-component system chemotaxis response regulator CheY